MSEPLKITVFDPATGTEEVGYIEPGNYMVIAAAPCYLDGTNSYANGTTVVTIKGRNPGLMGIKESGRG